MDRILYGCAYYDEYMPEERLEKDMAMMRDAGITWTLPILIISIMRKGSSAG